MAHDGADYLLTNISLATKAETEPREDVEKPPASEKLTDFHGFDTYGSIVHSSVLRSCQNNQTNF